VFEKLRRDSTLCAKTLQERRRQNPLRIREKMLKRNRVVEYSEGRQRSKPLVLEKIFQASGESTKAQKGAQLSLGEPIDYGSLKFLCPGISRRSTQKRRS
jgi:hypothetical protein